MVHRGDFLRGWLPLFEHILNVLCQLGKQCMPKCVLIFFFCLPTTRAAFPKKIYTEEVEEKNVSNECHLKYL